MAGPNTSPASLKTRRSPPHTLKARLTALKFRHETPKFKRNGAIKKRGIATWASKRAKVRAQDLHDKIQDSPLLRLPAELRLIIYEYAIGGQEIMPVRADPNDRRKITLHARIDTPGAESSAEAWANLLSTTLVCKQIKHETALMPFRLNVVTDPTHCMREFLAQLKPAYKDQITTCTLGCDIYLTAHKGLLEEVEKCPKLNKIVFQEFPGHESWRNTFTSSWVKLMDLVERRKLELDSKPWWPKSL